jgi:hypothetical protein
MIRTDPTRYARVESTVIIQIFETIHTNEYLSLMNLRKHLDSQQCSLLHITLENKCIYSLAIFFAANCTFMCIHPRTFTFAVGCHE